MAHIQNFSEKSCFFLFSACQATPKYPRNDFLTFPEILQLPRSISGQPERDLQRFTFDFIRNHKKIYENPRKSKKNIEILQNRLKSSIIRDIQLSKFWVWGSCRCENLVGEPKNNVSERFGTNKKIIKKFGDEKFWCRKSWILGCRR